MSKTSKPLGSLAELHPHFKEYSSLPQHIRTQIESAIPPNAWVRCLAQGSFEEFAPKYKASWEDKEAVVQGQQVCRICDNEGSYSYVVEAETTWEDKPIVAVKELKDKCPCQIWRHLWKMAKQSLPPMYDKVNLWVIKPHPMSMLPKEKQAEEIAYIQQHRNENFLFLGPSGVGKTTFSSAILRHAYCRKENSSHFWDKHLYGLEYTEDRWIWRTTFYDLMNQTNAKNKEQWGETIKSPEVTAEKIKSAKDRKLRPVLVLEEVDKMDMNSHRLNLLSAVLDNMLNVNGQIIITSNLNLNDVLSIMPSNIVRRLTQTINVRNYFGFTPEVPLVI